MILHLIFRDLLKNHLESNLKLKKGFNAIEEYCGKMKMLTDKLASARESITSKDLLIRILNGLGPSYLHLASIITANKMDYDEAYVLLFTSKVRLIGTNLQW